MPMPMDQVRVETKYWHAKMTRAEAERFLADKPAKTFVLRPGSKSKGIACSAVTDSGKVDHGRILIRGTCWTLDGTDRSYDSLAELLRSQSEFNYED
mmetsp:Transcript_2939/g.4717  ORF Transcript_2939/g.4717 Transcript_2939/m.4717 type:complete len:97 (+) Transcript_2939:1699-1989(+)